MKILTSLQFNWQPNAIKTKLAPFSAFGGVERGVQGQVAKRHCLVMVP